MYVALPNNTVCIAKGVIREVVVGRCIKVSGWSQGNVLTVVWIMYIFTISTTSCHLPSLVCLLSAHQQHHHHYQPLLLDQAGGEGTNYFQNYH